MRRFARVSCLLFAMSLAVPFNGGVAHAARTTPIESVPVVHRNSVITLSSSHADNFQGFTLDHGYHFDMNGSIVLNLGGAYTELVATAYNVSGTRSNSSFVFQDVSNAATGIRHLSTVSIHGGSQRSIKVNVHGVMHLSIVLRFSGCVACYPDTDLVGVFVGSPPRYVIASYPSPNAVIPANTSVVFLWHSFAGATAYLLRVWMVKQSGTTAITPTTPLTVSQAVFGHTSYTWNDKGFLPGTYQYDLMPVDQYGNALAGATGPIQFTIASPG